MTKNQRIMARLAEWCRAQPHLVSDWVRKDNGQIGMTLCNGRALGVFISLRGDKIVLLDSEGFHWVDSPTFIRVLSEIRR